MKYLFNNWNTIEGKLKNDRKLFICFDYDGTLTPIVSKPELAKLDAETKAALKKISENKKIIPAIVSGRPLKEIKKLVGLKNIIYAGNHGFEVETRIAANRWNRETDLPARLAKATRLVFDESKRVAKRAGRQARIKLAARNRREIGTQIYVQPGAKKTKPVLQKIRKFLERKIKSIKGAFVENKGLTLSVHWRLTDKKDLPKLFAIIRGTIRNNPTTRLHTVGVSNDTQADGGINSHLRLTKGKKVWEIRPNIDWHKGKAVKYILSLIPRPSSIVPVFVGDDTTDEDAFRVFKNGITVRVGKSARSSAKYYIKNQSGIKKLLNRLIA